jgi:hypothetical protein
MRNLGNTCYFNAVVQVLSNTQSFCDYFIRIIPPSMTASTTTTTTTTTTLLPLSSLPRLLPPALGGSAAAAAAAAGLARHGLLLPQKRRSGGGAGGGGGAPSGGALLLGGGVGVFRGSGSRDAGGLKAKRGKAAASLSSSSPPPPPFPPPPPLSPSSEWLAGARADADPAAAGDAPGGGDAASGTGAADTQRPDDDDNHNDDDHDHAQNLDMLPPRLLRQSTVQCFANTKSKTNKKNPIEKVSLCVELHHLLRVLWSGRWACCTPHALFFAVRRAGQCARRGVGGREGGRKEGEERWVVGQCGPTRSVYVLC